MHNMFHALCIEQLVDLQTFNTYLQEPLTLQSTSSISSCSILLVMFFASISFILTEKESKYLKIMDMQIRSTLGSGLAFHEARRVHRAFGLTPMGIGIAMFFRISIVFQRALKLSLSKFR